MHSYLRAATSKRSEQYDRAAFGDALQALVKRFGLRFYMACHFPTLLNSGFEQNLLATNWPGVLREKYRTTDMYEESKVIAGLRSSVMPYFSESLLHARAVEEGIRTEVTGMFYDPGFRRTVGISLHDANRAHYAFMFSGSRSFFQDDELAMLLFESMKVLDKFADTLTSGGRLTPREIDCLRWAAAGKSSEEIAMILSLSSYTVNDYLRGAMRKLDAVNRTQAVAAAAKRGII